MERRACSSGTIAAPVSVTFARTPYCGLGADQPPSIPGLQLKTTHPHIKPATSRMSSSTSAHIWGTNSARAYVNNFLCLCVTLIDDGNYRNLIIRTTCRQTHPPHTTTSGGGQLRNRPSRCPSRECATKSHSYGRYALSIIPVGMFSDAYSTLSLFTSILVRVPLVEQDILPEHRVADFTV